MDVFEVFVGGDGFLGVGFGGVFGAEEVEFDDVVSEEEGDGPVEDDAEAAFPAGHLHDVVGAPDPPGEEAADFEGGDAADAGVVAEGGEHAEGLVFEGLEFWGFLVAALLGADDGGDVFGEGACFAESVLGEGRVGLAVFVGDGGAVAEGPDFGAFPGAHGGFDDDAAVAGFLEGEVVDEGVGDDAGAEHDGFGVDDLFSSGAGADAAVEGWEEDLFGFDFGDLGVGVDFNAAVLEGFGGVGGEVFFHFGEDSLGGFDEDEAGDVAGDAGVGAEEGFDELGEFAHELDADEASADDDGGEEFASAVGVFFDIGLFEEVDDAVSEVDGVAEGFEGEGVFAAGDEFEVGDAAEGEDEVVVIEFVDEVVGGVPGENAASFEIDAFDVGFDEAGLFEHGADGIDGVAGFEDAGAGLEEEGRHEEVVVAGDEGDFDGGVGGEFFLEVVGGVDAAEAAAEDEDAFNIFGGEGGIHKKLLNLAKVRRREDRRF